MQITILRLPINNFLAHYRRSFFVMFVALMSLNSPVVLSSQVTYGPYFSFNCEDEFIPIGGQTVSEINPNGLAFVNKKIYISGTFVADKNLVFVNCKVKMGPGAQIVTQGNVILLASKTVFGGCGSSWARVQINQGAKFRFTTCLFRDSESSAIKIGEGYQPSAGFINYIRDCVFVNNRFGIYAAGNHQQINLTQLSFYGNKFLKKEAVAPTGVTLIPTRAGIYLSNCIANIGSTGTVNIFEGTGYNSSGHLAGIEMYSSIVRVANCEFNNFTSYNGIGISASALGDGIYAAGSSKLTVEATPQYNKCVFRSTVRGIRTDNILSLSVKGNEFYDDGNYSQDWAVLCQNNPLPADIRIENNLILFKRVGEGSGIYVDRPGALNASSPESKISKNIIRLEGGFATQYGINIVGSNTAYNKMYIEENEVHFARRAVQLHGIFIRSMAPIVRGYKIMRNKVYYDSPLVVAGEYYNGFGIALEDSYSGETEYSQYIHEINDNTVYAATHNTNIPGGGLKHNSNSVVQCAIHAVDCPYTRIEGNEVTNAFRDFHIWSDMSMCDFRCNIMNNANYGLACSGSVAHGVSDMSDQIQKGNLWTQNTYHHLGAVAFDDGTLYGSVLPGTPGYNFRANPEITYNFPPTWEPYNWFIEELGRPVCSSSFEHPGISVDSLLSPIHFQIVTGETPPTLSAATLWDEKRKLSLALLRSPGITAAGGAASAWQEANMNSNEYKSALAEKGIYDIPVDEAMAVEMAFIMKKLEQKSLQIDSLSAEMESFAADTMSIGNAMNILAKDISELWMYKDSIFNKATENRLGLLDVMENEVQTLEVNTVYEKSRQRLLLWIIALKKGQALNDQDLEYIREKSINGCIADEGSSVNEMINLLPIEERFLITDTEDRNIICSGERTHSSQKTASIFMPYQVMITPNPGNSFVNVVPLSPDTHLVEWAIYNLTGVKCMFGNAVSATQKIETTTLISGTYFMVGTLGNGQQFVNKFSVQH